MRASWTNSTTSTDAFSITALLQYDDAASIVPLGSQGSKADVGLKMVASHTQLRHYRLKQSWPALLGLAAALLSLGCAGIIGADFDRERRPEDAAGLDSPEEPIVDDVSTDASESGSDAGVDQGVETSELDAGADVPGDGNEPPNDPPVCGDMSGLQAGSPWPMENYCPTRTSRGPKAFHKGRKLHWSVTFDERVATSPVIAADGTVYVGTIKDPPNGSTTLRAVSSGGDKKWGFPAPNAGYPCSAAALGADGTVYFADMTTLYALNPTGTEKRNKAIGMFARSITLGPAGRLYGGTREGYVFAAELSDLSIPWSLKVEGVAASGVALGLDGNLYATSVGGTGGGCLHSIQPDGSLRWTVQLTGPLATDGLGTLAPAIGADGLVYVVENAGTIPAQAPVLRAFRSDKSQAFELPLGGHIPPPGAPVIGGQDSVYSLQGYSVVALNSGGAVLWSEEFSSAFVSAATGSLHNELCAGGTGMGTGGYTAQLLCVGPEGKATQGFDSMVAPTGLNGRFTPIAVDSDGRLYFGLDSQLMAVGD